MNSVIIVAAGNGARMRMGISKQFIDLDGVPVLIRAINAFDSLPQIDTITVVTRKRDIADTEGLVKKFGIKKVNAVIEGGETRQQSVMCGLSYLSADKADNILIHDGARPFIRQEHILKLLSELEEENCRAAALGVPVKDTIKQIDVSGFITSTPDRNSLISIQTPQCFKYGLIMKAHIKAKNKGLDYTDDCAVIENLTSERVKVVIGDYNNIKITTPEDIPLAEKILEEF